MDVIKAQLARLQQQLAGLSASQKMLTATLVTIMVMTLFYWGKYAGEPELQPVLNQSLTPESIASMSNHLDLANISYSIVGDRLMVPTDKKMQALITLGAAQALPSDMSSGMDDFVKQLSPLESQTNKDRMWMEAKQAMLARIIRGFPNVSSATVVIDPREERRIGDSVQASASIMIATRNGPGSPKQLAAAAAAIVSGSQAGLKKGQIQIVVNGSTIRLNDDDEANMARGNEIIELTSQHEKYFRTKILDQISFIRGAMVSVTVALNTKQMTQNSTTLDPKNVVQKETSVETETNESSGGGTGGEPGVSANTGASVVGAGSGGSTTNQEKNKTQFMVDVSKTVTNTIAPSGDATVVSASVRVPRSYFVNNLRGLNKGKDPDDTAVQAFIQSELPKIRSDVKNCTNLKNDEAISVETYADIDPSLDPNGNPIPEIASSPVTIALGGHTKEIAIGALAVISLFMLMMMVRKSQPAPFIPVIAEVGPPQNLGGGEEPIGTVGDGNPMLDGIELDEEAVKTQQVMTQVADMVKESPDAAAALVKRWLNRN